SFQAVSQLAIPLVSTEAERRDEFDLSPSLKTKIDSPATVLCRVDAAPEEFADAIIAAQLHRADAIGVDLSASWDEAARRHLAFYDRLIADRRD
ncbi:hypothetical protein AB4156_41395, partial [Cupriavidus sp. 2MCAB6]